MNSKSDFKEIEDALVCLPQWLQSGQFVSKSNYWIHNQEAIGGMVRRRRANAKMSLRSLAKWMSVTPSYLSYLERGLRPWPISRLNDVTEVLEMAERKINKK